MLGKSSIPNIDGNNDGMSDLGKKKSMIIELNEIAYTELILLIDVKASSGKVTFNIIRGYKAKDHPDGNGAISWERLKNKYDPISAPSMLKLEKQFRKL
jgi:hypothetical protein